MPLCAPVTAGRLSNYDSLVSKCEMRYDFDKDFIADLLAANKPGFSRSVRRQAFPRRRSEAGNIRKGLDSNMYMRKLTHQVVQALIVVPCTDKSGKCPGFQSRGPYIFRGIKYDDAKRFHQPEHGTAPGKASSPRSSSDMWVPKFNTPITS
jgi:hypothetical protein